MTEEIEAGAREIGDLISSCLLKSNRSVSKGCLIGRFGTIECEVCASGSKAQIHVLERNAGVFPGEDWTSWANKYLASMAAADILALGWYAPTALKEKSLLHIQGWKGKQIKLRSLEPYYVQPEDRWTRYFADQDVCVVSSFTQTVEKQVKKGGVALFGLGGETILPPTARWHFVRTGYSPVLAQGRATWTEALGESVETWDEAVEACVKDVLKTEAKIVLIGCGGLGMIIGSRLKAAGKICIVLGGAIQVLFGIKGGRWAKHPFIGRLWNSEWVWPAIDETPAGAEEVEGACYWSSAAGQGDRN